MKLETFLFFVLSPANACLIIILNIVEIIFICKMKMVQRKKSTVFILNLAISDLILGLIIVLVKILSMKTLRSIEFVSILSSYLRHSFIQVTLMASVLTNNILTTERFLAVKHPHVYNRITKAQRRNMCFVVWFLAIAITVCFFFADTRALSLRYYQQFIILSSIIVLSLPWPIVSYTMIRRVFKQRFSQTRGSSFASNGAPRHATFPDGQRFLILCLRSFIIFVICWLPYAAFGLFIFIDRGVSQESNNWLFPLQYTIHLLAFINSLLNPILYLYTYSFGKSVRRHFRSRRENKMKSTITIRALGGEEGAQSRTSLSNTVSNLTSTSSV